MWFDDEGFHADLTFHEPTGMYSWFTNNFQPVFFQHICFVLNGDVGTLYLNGVKVESKTFEGKFRKSYAPLWIGYENFFGGIDEVLVTKTSLNVAQIQAHYASDVAFLVAEGIYPSFAAGSVQV